MRIQVFVASVPFRLIELTTHGATTRLRSQECTCEEASRGTVPSGNDVTSHSVCEVGVLDSGNDGALERLREATGQAQVDHGA